MSELEQQLKELKQHIEDNKKIAKKAKKSKLTYKISKTYLLSLLINIPLAFILHSITPSPIIIPIISPILSLTIGAIFTVEKNEDNEMSEQRKLENELDATIEAEQAEVQCQVIKRLLECSATAKIEEQQFTILNCSTIKYSLANVLHTQVPHHEISEVAGAEHLIFGLFSAFIYNLPFIILHSFPSSLMPAIECLLGLWGHHYYKKKQAKNYHEAIERLASNIYDDIVDPNQLGPLLQSKNEAITSITISQLSKIPKHDAPPTVFSQISPVNHKPSEIQSFVPSKRLKR